MVNTLIIDRFLSQSVSVNSFHWAAGITDELINSLIVAVELSARLQYVMALLLHVFSRVTVCLTAVWCCWCSLQLHCEKSTLKLAEAFLESLF